MQIRRRRQVRFEKVTLEPAESFAARDFRLGSFPFAWHHHPELELTLIVRGQGLRFVGDSVESFADGDLCMLGAAIPHTWQSEPVRGPVRALVVQFLPQAWGEAFLDLPELRKVTDLFEQARRSLAVTGEVRDRVAELMGQLFADPAGSACRLGRLLAILSALADALKGPNCRALTVAPCEPPRGGRAERMLRRVLDGVHGAADEMPSQADMAAVAGLSAAAFSRFFKRHMGKPYVQYLNDWRIGQVCRLLADTDRDITAIAFDAGFQNLSNFNRRFKAAKAMTPRAYRALTQK